MTHQKEAELSYRLFCTYRNSRQEWLDERIAEQQFAMGQMWTTEESKMLKDRGQVDYVWNRIYPYLRHYESLLTGRTPEAKLIPTGDVEKDLVLVMNDVMDYILHISYWPQQFRRTVKSLLTKGVGWMWIYADPFSSGGLGDVKVEYVNVQDVYVPEDSAGVLFSDAEAIILSRIIPLRDAKLLYPGYGSDMEREAFEGRDDTEHKKSMMGEKERQDSFGPQETAGSPEFKNIRIIHRYTKERKKVWRLLNSMTGEELEFDKEPVVGSVLPEEGAYGVEWEKAAYIVTHIKEVTSAGTNVYIGENVLPLEDWPLIPFLYDDPECPYPISAVTLHKGQQKLLNRFASLSLAGVQHSMGPKIIAKEGSIDKGTWQKEFSLPNSVNIIRGGYEPKDVQIVQISPIPAAMFNMMEEIKREISFETASSAMHQGSSEGIPPTLGQTQTLQEESTRRMSPVIQQVDISIQRMYEVMLQMIPVVYDNYRVLTIIDSDNLEPRRVEINAEQRDEETLEVVETLNDIRKFRARVMVRTGSSVEPSRVANLMLFSQLAQQFPDMAKYVFRYMDIPNARQLEREFDENAKLKQVVETYKDQMEELQQLLGQLQEAVTDEKEKVKLQKIQSKLDALYVRAEARIQIAEAQQKEQPKPEKR